MKIGTPWKLGAAALLALGLSACSSTTTPEDEDDTSAVTPSKNKSSSSIDDLSSSSKNDVKCDSLSALAAPTNLQVVKNGDNKWVLFWNYAANDSRPESNFLIEVLDMSDSIPKWDFLDTTNAEVVMYNLVGESKAGKYYRVSAKDQCGVSKPTDMLQVVSATGTSTTSSAELAVPTNLKLDTLSDNMWQLSWSYTNNANRPENGFKLQSLDLGAESPKWKDDGTTNKGVHVIKIDGTKKGGLLFHVAAKDTNGISEYSAEITIPRMPDSTDLATNADIALATPSDLKIEAIGENKYQLSWSYIANSARPENGFKLQSLDINAKNPAWTVTDSTNKGVRYIVLDATKRGGNYIRVAAKDSKGLSAYSSEIQIPKPDTAKTTAQTEELAVPASIKLDTLGENQYRISWSYTNNKKRPEAGFKAQYLDMTATVPAWKDYPAEIKTGVHYLNVYADTYGGMFFHIAAKDSKGEVSAYSSEVMIPKFSVSTNASEIENVSMSIPTNLKIDSISPTVRRLSWSYTNVTKRPENGFIIQHLDLNQGSIAWATIDSTNKGVHYWNIDLPTFSKQYLRVAAKDTGSNYSEFSADIMVPEYIATTTVNTKVDLATPSGLKLEAASDTTWRLSWNYTRAKGRSETGFIVQSLSLDDADPEWEFYNTTKAGVKTILLNSKTHGGIMFRVAAYDENDTTEYTTEVQLPTYNERIVKLAVPTNVTLDSLEPNKWRISWRFTDNEERPATGFKLESIDATNGGSWTELATTAKDIQFYVVTIGTGSPALYVRVSATDGKTPAGGSSEKVLIPKYTDPSAPVAALNVPTNVKIDSIGQNLYQISWNYTEVKDHLSTGFKLEYLEPGNGKSWSSTGITPTKAGVKVYTVDATTYGGYYFRVAATDGEGIGDYSSEVLVPQAKDYTEPTVDLNAPTALKLDSLGNNEYLLSWSYTNAKGHEATGFKIEKLKIANSSTWEAVDATIASGVQFYKLSEAYCDYYVRVYAIGTSETDKSEYSAPIRVPAKYEEENVTTLPATPTDLTIEPNGTDKYLLSWSYTNNAANPENGFKLQFLDLNNGSTWTDGPAVNTGVHYAEIDATVNGGNYVRVAAIGKNGTNIYSEYSADIKIPEASSNTDQCSGNLAAPKSLTATRLAPSVWQLSWSYERSATCAEKKFIVQKLNVKDPGSDWTDLPAIESGIHYLILEGYEGNIGNRYRVKAINGENSSEFSNTLELNTLIQYNVEFNFKAPTLKSAVYKTTSGKYEMKLTVVDNFPNRAMENNGDYANYTASIEYEFRWFKDEDVQPVITKVATGGETVIVLNTFTNRYEVCNAYAQVRTIWTDNLGGEEKTEWSKPSGSMPGYTLDYDPEDICECRDFETNCPPTP